MSPSCRNGMLLFAFALPIMAGCREPARFDPNDPLTGVWIGEWDSRWTVMFIIKRSGEQYDVVYKWEEAEGQPFSRERIRGDGFARELKIGNSMHMRLDDAVDNKATVRGNFQSQRRAKLFRIKEAEERDLTISYVEGVLSRIKEK